MLIEFILFEKVQSSNHKNGVIAAVKDCIYVLCKNLKEQNRCDQDKVQRPAFATQKLRLVFKIASCIGEMLLE